jgi:hypothetical protein
MSGILRVFGLLLTVASCALLSPISAEAAYVSFPQWRQMPEAERAAYIAGAFDAYLAFSQAYAPSAEHYRTCVQKLSMPQGLLSHNVLSFAAARPALHGQNVPGIVIQYLYQTCGSPP